jgi:hypothetical protein
MARDFEDMYDIENMSDTDLSDLIRQELDDSPNLDATGLDIQVAGGHVVLAGRVGTDGELRAIEHLLTDTLGLKSLTNELVVDDLVRAEQPEAADVANAEAYARPRGERGGADRTEDSAAHLLDDTGADQFGTSDAGEAIERGYSWNPPSEPTGEGHGDQEVH